MENVYVSILDHKSKAVLCIFTKVVPANTGFELRDEDDDLRSIHRGLLHVVS
jgi:hypothetical protein